MGRRKGGGLALPSEGLEASHHGLTQSYSLYRLIRTPGGRRYDGTKGHPFPGDREQGRG